MKKFASSDQLSLFDVEIWLPVVGFEGRYEVSSLGRVRALFAVPNSHYKSGRILCPTGNKKARYKMHTLTSGVRKTHQVYLHHLVLKAFSGPCPAGQEALHHDGNPANNKISNLRWGTHTENIADADRHGTFARGERMTGAKLTVEKVRGIRDRWRSGETQVSIARTLDVSPGTVWKIIRHIRWKHIP